jgi:hypothetical protein
MDAARAMWIAAGPKGRRWAVSVLREEERWQERHNGTAEGRFRAAVLRAAVAVLEEAAGKVSATADDSGCSEP